MEPTLPCGFSGTQQQRIERIDRAQNGPERAASVGLVRVPVSLEPSDEELLQPFHEDGALLVGLEELLAKPVGGMQHLGLTHGLCTHQGQVGGGRRKCHSTIAVERSRGRARLRRRRAWATRPSSTPTAPPLPAAPAVSGVGSSTLRDQALGRKVVRSL